MQSVFECVSIQTCRFEICKDRQTVYLYLYHTAVLVLVVECCACVCSIIIEQVPHLHMQLQHP